MASKNQLSRPLVNLVSNPTSKQDAKKKATNATQKPAGKGTTPPPVSGQK